MKYFLGVDIGGSKSHAVIADEGGQVLGSGKGGPGNHEGVGLDGFRDTLHGIVNQALESSGIERKEITGAGLGIAGFDWPSDYEPHRQVIDTLELDAPYQFVNDAVLGLVAGARQGWGVSVVAGTGNNCRGRDTSGREGRVAGVSYWTGEYGGGGDLTRKAIEKIWLAWTRRGPETQLTQKFLELVDAADPLALIEGLSRGRFYLGAAQAPIVFETAREDDAVAQECLRWMGREVGDLAVGVIRQLNFEVLSFEVILTGSMFKGSPMIAEAMAETIHAVAPGAQLAPLNAPPVIGGVLLGMERFGVDYAAVRPNLIEGTTRLLYGDQPAVSFDSAE
jgi:N-acetylglucosamine kinase-like BadF-type ATPase